MSEPILRVFIPSGERLSDGSFLRRHAIPLHRSCKGDTLELTVAGQRWTLRANVSAVSAGDRRQTISASGRKHEQTFPADGTAIDLILPKELLHRVRAATLRRGIGGIGLAAVFARTGTVSGEEFSGCELTADRAAIDAGAQFELIEI